MAADFDTVRTDRFGNKNTYGTALGWMEYRQVQDRAALDRMAGEAAQAHDQVAGDLAALKTSVAALTAEISEIKALLLGKVRTPS